RSWARLYDGDAYACGGRALAGTFGSVGLVRGRRMGPARRRANPGVGICRYRRRRVVLAAGRRRSDGACFLQQPARLRRRRGSLRQIIIKLIANSDDRCRMDGDLLRMNSEQGRAPYGVSPSTLLFWHLMVSFCFGGIHVQRSMIRGIAFKVHWEDKMKKLALILLSIASLVGTANVASAQWGGYYSGGPGPYYGDRYRERYYYDDD